MSLETIRAAIVAKLNAIPGIGLVHGYERFASGEKDFRAMYSNGSRILGWHVRRVATEETSVALGRWQTIHRWEIRGYAGLSDADASEIAMDNLMEAIRDAFRADDSLGGAVDTCTRPDAAGIQIADSGPVMFAGVLCHGVRLTLRTVQSV
jgi:hypothetical protein